MKPNTIYMNIQPDAFTGILLSILGFLVVGLFTKAIKAFDSLSELKTSHSNQGKDVTQVQKDISKLEKRMDDFEDNFNRKNHGRN